MGLKRVIDVFVNINNWCAFHFLVSDAEKSKWNDSKLINRLFSAKPHVRVFKNKDIVESFSFLLDIIVQNILNPTQFWEEINPFLNLWISSYWVKYNVLLRFSSSLGGGRWGNTSWSCRFLLIKCKLLEGYCWAIKNARFQIFTFELFVELFFYLSNYLSNYFYRIR